MLPDHILLKRVQEQEQAAFEALYCRYGGALRRHLQQFLRDDAAAEDLLQEVFLRVWTKAEQWNGQGACRAWLFRIATNLALNWLRSERRRREQPLEVTRLNDSCDDEDGTGPGWLIDTAADLPEQICEAAELHRLLSGLIETLPEKKREVVRLLHERELEPQEIAEMMEMPPGTVRSRLHYARKHLTPLWKNIAPEWED